MGVDKSFLNAQGMWYGGDLEIQQAHLKDRAATVLHSGKKTPSSAKKA